MSHGLHGLFTDGIRYKNYNKFDQKLSKIVFLGTKIRFAIKITKNQLLTSIQKL